MSNVSDFHSRNTAQNDEPISLNVQIEDRLLYPDDEVIDAITGAHSSIKSMEDDKKEITKNISAIYDVLEDLGITKDAAKLAFKLIDMSEEQRRSYDVSAIVLRCALQIPRQADLFGPEQGQIAELMSKSAGGR